MKVHFSICILIILLASCGREKDNIHEQNFINQLREAKRILIRENHRIIYNSEKDFINDSISYRYSNKIIQRIHLLSEFYASINDTTFEDMYSENDLRIIFYKSAYGLQKIVHEIVNKFHFFRRWKMNSLNYLELENEENRTINLIVNQNNILVYANIFLMRLQEMWPHSETCDFNNIVVNNRTIDKGELINSSLILSGAWDTIEAGNDFRLDRMTCNGKPVKLKHKFSMINNIRTFSFTPTDTGFYNWQISRTITQPDGEKGQVWYKGEIKVTDK